METIEALAVGDWVAVSRYTTVVKPIQLIQDAMKIIYTTEEVKAKLAEILKAVSAGESITVTEEGIPVAEIRRLPEERRKPYSNSTDKLEQHLEEMRRRGVLGPAAGPRKEFKETEHIPGALESFLEERK